MTAIDVPILFLVFNRPELTAEVFNSIRAARPARLYVAADGPREMPGEAETCAQVQEIATSVDWPCEVFTQFQGENLGCRYGVQAGIDWFFANEESGVILEDDCIPDPTFWPFIGELLDRYRDDERVQMISGDYFAGDGFGDGDYYFTRYTHIWGWATWRRAWRNFDATLTEWPGKREDGWLASVHADKDFVRYWTDVFDRVHAGEIDTWDYSWQYSVWRAGGLVAAPTRNLITNIGFGTDATHTIDGSAWQSRLPTIPLTLPIRHPAVVADDTARDEWTDENLFRTRQPSLRRRLSRRLRALR